MNVLQPLSPLSLYAGQDGEIDDKTVPVLLTRDVLVNFLDLIRAC